MCIYCEKIFIKKNTLRTYGYNSFFIIKYITLLYYTPLLEGGGGGGFIYYIYLSIHSYNYQNLYCL